MSNSQKKSPAATQPQSQPQPMSPQSFGSQFSTLRINTGREVNQDGAFLQDKVIKSGWLFKRTRKTRVLFLPPLFPTASQPPIHPRRELMLLLRM